MAGICKPYLSRHLPYLCLGIQYQYLPRPVDPVDRQILIYRISQEPPKQTRQILGRDIDFITEFLYREFTVIMCFNLPYHRLHITQIERILGRVLCIDTVGKVHQQAVAPDRQRARIRRKLIPLLHNLVDHISDLSSLFLLDKYHLPVTGHLRDTAVDRPCKCGERRNPL